MSLLDIMTAQSQEARDELDSLRAAAGRADIARMLAEFHAALGQPFGHGDLTDMRLRRELHEEEHDELLDALDDARDAEQVDERHLEAVAQELADVVYVAYGTAHSLGIPLDAVLAAVHRANMTKFDEQGRPILSGNGKLLRSARYVPADVASVLAGTPAALKTAGEPPS